MQDFNNTLKLDTEKIHLHADLACFKFVAEEKVRKTTKNTKVQKREEFVRTQVHPSLAEPSQ